MKITATTEGKEFNSAEWCEAMAAVLRAEGKLEVRFQDEITWYEARIVMVRSLFHYRKVIEQKMIRVTLMSGEVVEWPDPIREVLVPGTKYFLAGSARIAISMIWHDDENDLNWLSLGISHLTLEAAEQHLAALRKINAQGGA